jgi:hypothetical protein
LRRSTLGGDSAGWRLGLAELERRGVAGWLRAWPSTDPPTTRRTAHRTPKPTVLRSAGAATGPHDTAAEELVGVLAEMALACVDRR